MPSQSGPVGTVKLGRPAKYTSVEEKKKAHYEASRRYVLKNPEMYRKAGVSYYERNKEAISARRKERYAMKKKQKMESVVEVEIR